MATIGNLPEFQTNDDWLLFQERLEQFFEANSIKAKKKVATLITVLSTGVYKTLRDLCYPVLPKDIEFQNICGILSKRFSKVTSAFSERKEFYDSRQREYEEINEWYERVKKLAVNCRFENNLNFALLDKFVTGLVEGKIADRLFEEDPTKVDLDKLVQMALAKEAVLKKRNKELFPLEDGRRQFGSKKEMEISKKCFYCGKTGHNFARCAARKFKCRNCSKIGHAAAACLEGKNHFINKDKERESNFICTDKEKTDLSFFNLTCNGITPFICKVKINGEVLNFQIDTGASISAISLDTYYKHFRDIEMEKTEMLLRLYNGKILRPMGSLKVVMEVEGVSKECTIMVIEHGGPPLLGRDLFRSFGWSISRNRNGMECLDNNSLKLVALDIQKLLEEYNHLFKDELGAFKFEKVALSVKENTVPIFCKPRKLPLAYKAKVEEELTRLEKDNVIKKVANSAWGTPLVPVLKKDGSIRLCADYRVTVNKFLEDFKYPLPLIDELFAALQGGKQFSKIDLSQAYNQLLLEDSTKLLLAWSTHKGIYQMERLPFGTKPACAIFQSIVEKTLQGIPNVINFLDDIVVTGKDKEQHLLNLRLVFERLSEAGLRIKSDKCKFLQDEISYLGFVINKEGLKKDPGKVSSIIEAPRPENVTQVKSFAGMVNYYGKFINNVAHIMKPLYGLLTKEVEFKWGKDQERAFKEAKEAIIADTVLVHFDPTLPLVLSCDASQGGIGAVLSHLCPEGEKPIAFASRVFMPAEQNYSMLDKEALAIYFGVKKFAQFLLGHKFTLKTDHRPLIFLFGENKGIPQMAAGRLQRWAVYLSAFDFDIIYIKGVDNYSADCLSRLPVNVNFIVEPDSSYLNFVQSEVPVDVAVIREKTLLDPILCRVIEYINKGWPREILDNDLKVFFMRRLELYVEQGVIMWGHRVVIPKELRDRVLRELHCSHTGINKMKSRARAYVWWPGLDKDVEELIQNCEPCILARPDPPKAVPMLYEDTEEVFERIHIDFFGPVKNKMFLVIIDAFSKWPEVFEMDATTTVKTLEKLKETCARFGIPKKIISDNGTQFTSFEFKNFCILNGIKHITIPPFHPSTNGAAENAVGSVKTGLAKAFNDQENVGKSINTILSTYLLNYRCTIHCKTGQTPSQRMFGRSIHTRLDLMRPETKKTNVYKLTVPSNVKGRQIKFSVGEMVFVRDYRKVNKKSWIKAKVVKVIGPRVYKCAVNDTHLIWTRHIDQIIRGTTNSLNGSVK